MSTCHRTMAQYDIAGMWILRSRNVYTTIVYTSVVLEDILGFDWDIHNVSHIDRHDVSPVEIEDLFTQPHVIIPANDAAGEHRWKLFGRTRDGRYLTVVFTVRNKHLRTVTAYTMNQRERGIYGSQII